MFQTLLFSVTDHVATISFNRPEAMNSFNKVMADELKTVTDQVREDQTIKVVLLNGTGNLFMAGGDIHFFHQSLDTMPAGIMDIVRALNASILNLMQMPKPVVASVHGGVAGVGMSLMMACDLAIAADNTKFTMAYSGIGISPDGGASYNLPRLVGTKKAMELMFLSDRLDAHAAEQFGLINKVVPMDKLREETAHLVNRLIKGPLRSYTEIKRLVNNTWHSTLESQLEHEGRAFAACSMTLDFKAGVTGFLKKIKPEFTGQ